jgi:hypothetical protein
VWSTFQAFAAGNGSFLGRFLPGPVLTEQQFFAGWFQFGWKKIRVEQAVPGLIPRKPNEAFFGLLVAVCVRAVRSMCKFCCCLFFALLLNDPQFFVGPNVVASN